MIATDVGGERYRLVFLLSGKQVTAMLERADGESWRTIQAGIASAYACIPETLRRAALGRLHRKVCPPWRRATDSDDPPNAKAMRRLMRAYFDRPRGKRG